MTKTIWFHIVAVVALLTSYAGLLASILLNTQYIPWALAIMMSYVLLRVEDLHKKMRDTVVIEDNDDD